MKFEIYKNIDNEYVLVINEPFEIWHRDSKNEILEILRAMIK